MKKETKDPALLPDKVIVAISEGTIYFNFPGLDDKGTVDVAKTMSLLAMGMKILSDIVAKGKPEQAPVIEVVRPGTIPDKFLRKNP